MTREIKFKALSIDNKWWVFGDLKREQDHRKGGTRTYIWVDSEDIEEEGDYIQVWPQTVCQYSGVDDRDGQEIYENDILNRSFMDFYPDHKGIVAFRNGAFVINVNNDFRPLGDGFNWSDKDRYYEGEGVKVIGNIHDR